MGKDFSGKSPNRRAQDAYSTPPSMTVQLLLEYMIPRGATVLEPAAGEGKMVGILKGFFDRVDYADRERDFTDPANYREASYDWVITNPPYSLFFEFIGQAKRVAKQGIAMLLPYDYLHGSGRIPIWIDDWFPLEKVLVFTRKPALDKPLDEWGCYKTGMLGYAWFIWNRNHRGPATIGFIDNDHFVSRGRK